MAKNLKKCPVCSEKLQPYNGRMMCMSCGYSTAMDENEQQYNTGNISNQNIPNSQSNTIFNTTSTYARRKPKKRITTLIIIFVVIFLLALLMAFFMLIRNTSNGTDFDELFDEMFGEMYDWDYDYDYDYDWDNSIKETITINDDTFSDDIYETYAPESELFRLFVSEVFGKNYSLVTNEEYASITSLHIYYYENRIDYAINDGEIKIFLYDSTMHTDLDDLKFFTGLKSVNLEKEELYGGELDGLNNLTELWCANSARKLAEIVPYPLKIETLGLYDTYFEYTLEGIDNFPNVKNLYVSIDDLEDISALNTLNNLRSLTIDNGDNIVDFSPLATLTDLQAVSITSNQLKNISFIKNMTDLKEFTVNESLVFDISELSNHKNTLTKVHLSENYKITDYSVIGELTLLTDVKIGNSYDDIIPSFEKLTALDKLSLEGIGDVTIINTAKTITELTLKDCSLSNLSAISELKNIKKLILDNSSSYIKDLHSVMSLTELEYLDISNTKVFGNVEELFSLPKLKEFYMNDSSVSIDFSKITKNESLNVLSMNNISIVEYIDTDGDGFVSNADAKEVNITEGLSALTNFPKLTHLYLAGNDILNIDFASELKYLQIFDISNNYLSSLSPLAGLHNLKVIYCGGNTITEGLNLINPKVKILLSYD